MAEWFWLCIWIHHHPRTSVLHWVLTNRLLYSSMNDKEMFLVHVCYLHLSLLSIHSYACSHRSLFAVRYCHGPKHLFSWRRFFPHSEKVTSWWFCHDDAWLYCIFVWRVFGLHYPPLLKLLSNYSESNCYQTKSQKCYYSVIQSWQPHQSWMVPMIAAKSYFM